MRILFVAAPLQGHLLPLVPLAAACRAAGHDVILAGGGFPGDVMGLRTADIGRDFNLARSAVRVALRHPGIARAEMVGTAGQAMVGELFGRANMTLIGPLEKLAVAERPDLIVFESLAEAGAVVAGRLSIPSVLQENTLWPATELFEAVTCYSGLAKWNVPNPELTITVTPPSLRGGPLAGAVPMRAVPFSGGGSIPDWLLEPGAKPRVLVSRSTLKGPNDGNPMPAVVAAASAVDAEFVLVRPEKVRLERVSLEQGRLEQGRLEQGRLEQGRPEQGRPEQGRPEQGRPEKGRPGKGWRVKAGTNVRAVGRIPLDRALPHAAAFVHHSGAGSVLGGLFAGVPQLTTPGAGDRRYNAQMLAARGAGLSVDAKAITADDLTRLITDEGLRRAAREVAAEMAAMPEPAEVVPALEKLVSG